MKRGALTLAIGLLAAAGAIRPAAAQVRPLSLDDRVEAQRAIEEVLWRHRVWPGENAGAKPLLADLLSDAAIRERVVDDLARSEAVARLSGFPITAAQLRAEVERMAGSSRDPAMLAELFAALDDDPLRVAECLARPRLADRLLRSRFAGDASMQAAARREAEAAAASARDARSLRALGGAYGEVAWVLEDDGQTGGDGRRRGAATVGSREEWERLEARLAGWFGLRSEGTGRKGDPRRRVERGPAGWLDRLPVDRVSPVQETEDRFFVAAIVAKGPASVTVATASWPKRSFEEWWAGAREDLGREVLAEAAGGREAAVARSLGLEAAAADYGPLPAITGSTCTDGTWASVASGQVPEARDSHSAVWTGTEMIVWGGAGIAAGLNSGGRYLPATDTWTPTPIVADTPTPRWNHTAIWTGTEMIVWGGYSGEDDTNTGGRYNPVTGNWAPTSTAPGVPEIREMHTAVWTGAEMIVWGGDAMVVGYLGNGGRYSPATDSWAQVAAGTGAPAARGRHTAVWTGTEMIVWGGYNDLDGYLATGARYDPAGNAWTPTSTGSHLPAARGQHAAVWTGSEMIVWGGAGATPQMNSGARYDPVGNAWMPTSAGANVPAARYGHTAVWTGSEMIVWGGFSGIAYVGTGGRYRPADDSWTATPSGGTAPSARGYHTAVWSGSEMIVWGGYFFDGADRELATGGRYDPAADRWTPTTAWADRRRLHTAVWTGSEMIVWGGEEASPPAPVRILNSGGRYQPATDTWSSTSMGANLPAAREYHTAIWTGSEMIVWGGYTPPSTEHNTGGRYDPATDAWIATSTGAGAPNARDTHTAIWSGSEMIVWGGWNGLDAYATGSRYAPASNAWTAMAAGPQRRYAHTAVWTGTEMIVWGGTSRSSGSPAVRLNSGGRYLPGSNSWIATPVDASTPAARERHSAVWTGGEMIVWGGRDGALFLADGGRHVPGAGGWTATSAGVGAPAARAYHTAVWTGEEMIVWGGSFVDAQGEHPLDTGGRYDPASDAWTATSAGVGAAARTRHTAIWTGTEMIVWGGGDPASSLGTGARYCASLCAAAMPGELANLSLSGAGDATTIAWPALPGAGAYDLVRGNLLLLRSSGGNFATATGACVGNDTPATSVIDPAMPASRDGLWYLGRAVNCAGSGTYDSAAPGQVGSRDAEIAASPSACP